MCIRTPSVIICLLLILASPGVTAENGAGIVTLLTGRATAARADGTIRPLAKDQPVFAGEVLATGPSSYLNIRFNDGGRVLLRPNSRFEIEEFSYRGPVQAATPVPGAPAQPVAGNAFFRLLKGGFRAVTGLVGRENKEAYRVNTPVATIGIRGTDFEGRLCTGDCLDIDPVPEDGLYVGVNDGAIEISNEAGAFPREAGQFLYIAGQTTPAVLFDLRPPALEQDPIPDPEACE
ncbi:MAG TPA: FecR family protein [Gammaproteobacteria bacterium]|nr:FecR family protein [Gammaproteobacteria bacterium]